MVLVEKLKIKNAFCVQWLWRDAQSREQRAPPEKDSNPQSLLCLFSLNVKGLMKQLKTLQSLFAETRHWRGIHSTG